MSRPRRRGAGRGLVVGVAHYVPVPDGSVAEFAVDRTDAVRACEAVAGQSGWLDAGAGQEPLAAAGIRYSACTGCTEPTRLSPAGGRPAGPWP